MKHCNHRQHRSKLAVLVAVTVMMVAVVAVGVEPAGESEAGDDKAKRLIVHLRKAADDHRMALQEGMAVRVEEIDRAATLKEKQKKKLEIAAKGAVDRVVSDWLDNLLKNSNLEAQLGHLDEAMIAQSLASWSSNVTIEQVADHDLWTKAVGGILDAEQQQRWDAVRAENRAFARKVAIDQWVLTLNEQLRLSSDQRGRLAELLDELLDSDIAADTLIPQQQQRMVIIGHHGRKADPLEKVSDERMAQILTEVQLKRWRSLGKEIAEGRFGGGGHGWQGNGGFIQIDGGGIININGGIIVE